MNEPNTRHLDPLELRRFLHDLSTELKLVDPSEPRPPAPARPPPSRAQPAEARSGDLPNAGPPRPTTPPRLPTLIGLGRAEIVEALRPTVERVLQPPTVLDLQRPALEAESTFLPGLTRKRGPSPRVRRFAGTLVAGLLVALFGLLWLVPEPPARVRVLRAASESTAGERKPPSLPAMPTTEPPASEAAAGAPVLLAAREVKPARERAARAHEIPQARAARQARPPAAGGASASLTRAARARAPRTMRAGESAPPAAADARSNPNGRRVAVDLLLAGDTRAALEAYRALLRESPEELALQHAVGLLEREQRAQTAGERVP